MTSTPSLLNGVIAHKQSDKSKGYLILSQYDYASSYHVSKLCFVKGSWDDWTTPTPVRKFTNHCIEDKKTILYTPKPPAVKEGCLYEFKYYDDAMDPVELNRTEGGPALVNTWTVNSYGTINLTLTAITLRDFLLPRTIPDKWRLSKYIDGIGTGDKHLLNNFDEPDIEAVTERDPDFLYFDKDDSCKCHILEPGLCGYPLRCKICHMLIYCSTCTTRYTEEKDIPPLEEEMAVKVCCADCDEKVLFRFCKKHRTVSCGVCLVPAEPL